MKELDDVIDCAVDQARRLSIKLFWIGYFSGLIVGGTAGCIGTIVGLKLAGKL